MDDDQARQINANMADVLSRQLVCEIAMCALVRRIAMAAGDPAKEMSDFVEEVKGRLGVSTAQRIEDFPELAGPLADAMRRFVQMMENTLPHRDHSPPMN
ncbi:MAG: hypothetical protein WA975_03405 [Mesorhizobium sp.]